MKYSDKTQLLLENKQLFIASIEEFSTKSYKQSSTNEVIKNSGINKGSFYYRFNNKEELFIALADHIIVTQIDLFNKRNFNYSDKSLKDVLFELFINLHLLNNYDELFYKFIVSHLSDPESLDIIKNKCIEPLYFRLARQINTFKDINNFEYINVLISNLYLNFPDFLKKSSDIEVDLNSFIDFILVKPDTKQVIKTIDFSDFFPEEDISYFLMDSYDKINFDDRYYCLFDFYRESRKIDKELKKMTNMFFMRYQNLILSLIKKNFKDISYYNNLLNKKLISLSKSNKDFFIIFKILIYLSLKEVECIVIDKTLDILNQEAKALIYRDILPILSKTSKIVVISNSFTIDNEYKNLYIINNLNQIKKIDYEAIKTKYQNNYEIALLKQKRVTNLLLSKSELTNFLNDNDNLNSIKQIKSVATIDYQTIIRNDVLE